MFFLSESFFHCLYNILSPPHHLPFFFFNDTATTEIYTLSLHDALPILMMYKVVRSSRLYEQIVQQVEESIQKGALKTGDKLPPERELAQQFGVSRTAVREAVKALDRKSVV